MDGKTMDQTNQNPQQPGQGELPPALPNLPQPPATPPVIALGTAAFEKGDEVPGSSNGAPDQQGQTGQSQPPQQPAQSDQSQQQGDSPDQPLPPSTPSKSDGGHQLPIKPSAFPALILGIIIVFFILAIIAYALVR
jgi:hypothetical protein